LPTNRIAFEIEKIIDIQNFGLFFLKKYVVAKRSGSFALFGVIFN